VTSTIKLDDKELNQILKNLKISSQTNTPQDIGGQSENSFTFGVYFLKSGQARRVDPGPGVGIGLKKKQRKEKPGVTRRAG
jgi:hypothetical protein